MNTLRTQEQALEGINKINALHSSGIPLEEACSSIGWTKNIYYNLRTKYNYRPPRVSRPVFSKTNLRWFHSVDTQEKAYFLGLIASDGCIHYPKSNRSSAVLSLKLKESDRELVDQLCNYISPERVPRVIYTDNKKFGYECQNMVAWSVNSDELVNDLKLYGIKPNKSREGLLFPSQLDKRLYRHYIRGYFDGNGYVSSHLPTGRTKNRATIAIVSTCLEFLETIASITPFSSPVDITKSDRNMPLYRIQCLDSDSISILYYYLYINSSHYLTRKKSKYDEVMSFIGNPVLNV